MGFFSQNRGRSVDEYYGEVGTTLYRSNPVQAETEKIKMKKLTLAVALILASTTPQTDAQIQRIYRDIRVEKQAPKPAPKQVVKIPSEKQPKWNIEGSWKRAFNKQEVMEHLAEDHGLDILQLKKFTINQLWTLHTMSHEGKSVKFAPLKKIKPQPLKLPPVQQSNT